MVFGNIGAPLYEHFQDEEESNNSSPTNEETMNFYKCDSNHAIIEEDTGNVFCEAKPIDSFEQGSDEQSDWSQASATYRDEDFDCERSRKMGKRKF